MSRILLLVFVIAACSQPTVIPDAEVQNHGQGDWQSDSVAPIRLTLEQTFADNEDEPRGLLGSALYAAVDPDGDVYVLEPFTGRLVSFAPDGSFRWEVNAPGEGPGEIRNPDPLYFLTPNGLVFSNQSATREERYSLEGEFQDSRTLGRPGYQRLNLAGLLPDARRVLRTGAGGLGGAKVLVPSASSVDSFTVDVSGDLEIPPVLAVPASVSVFQNQIVVTHLTRYGYSFYTPDGTLQRTVFRDVQIQPPIIREITGGVQVQSWARMYPPLLLSDGFWLAGGEWALDMGDPEVYLKARQEGTARPLTTAHTLDLFDEAGTHLYSLDAEQLEGLDIQRVLLTDGRNNLYALLKSGPYIGRFRVDVLRSL